MGIFLSPITRIVTHFWFSLLNAKSAHEYNILKQLKENEWSNKTRPLKGAKSRIP